jgi:tetratricopeptide (TPR) repeat protein
MNQAGVEDVGQGGSGEAFFERADEVAQIGNWDFAIELYLEGIRREPGNIERGHQKLWEASLSRKARGGKPAGMLAQIKRRGGKTPLEEMLNAEYLLARDPGAVGPMETIFKAARKLGLSQVAKWACDILFISQGPPAKPSKRVLRLLVDTYTEFEEYRLAIQACEILRALSPNDVSVIQKLSLLSARHTIQKGKYDQEGDFTQSVKDMARQKELIEKDSLDQGMAFMRQQVDRTRAEYLASPAQPGKIIAFVDALLKLENETTENEAIEVLTKAYNDLKAYQFRMRIGDIRIAQMTRRYRQLAGAGDKQGAAAQARRQLEFELEEYAERVVNYPTDLGLKYELGRRQFLAGKYDEAIGSLQQAQRDPRRGLRATHYLGQAFAKKGWLTEAVATLERALSGELTENQEMDLRYTLGDVLEQMGDPEHLQKALDNFSKVAMMDFNYKDVPLRVDSVRKKLSAPPSAPKG